MSDTVFEESEIEELRKGATGAGLLVAMSDRGWFDTFKEAGALAKHLAAAKESSGSPLIRRVADGHGSGFGLTARPDEVEAALRTAIGLVRRKAPDELDAYRAFVLDLARSVAAAAGGGDEAETAALAEIESAFEEA